MLVCPQKPHADPNILTTDTSSSSCSCCGVCTTSCCSARSGSTHHTVLLQSPILLSVHGACIATNMQAATEHMWNALRIIVPLHKLTILFRCTRGLACVVTTTITQATGMRVSVLPAQILLMLQATECHRLTPTPWESRQTLPGMWSAWLSSPGHEF